MSADNVRALQRLAGNRAVGQALDGPTREAGQSFGRMLQDLRGVREAPVVPPPVDRPAEPQDVVPPESEPANLAAEVAANRVPADGLRVPMDEAARPGAESQAALGRLRGAGDANPVLLGLGEAINERIAGLRDRTTANATRVSAELDAAAAEQRSAVREAFQTGRAGVDGAFGSARARVGQSARSARSALAQRGQSGRRQAGELARSETARLDQATTAGATQARSAFGDGDTEIHTKGETEAGRARGHSGDLAQRALALGRSEAARYRRTEEDKDLGERKAEAVMDVARRFAARLRDEGTELAGNLTEQAGESREQVGKEAESVVAGFAEVGKGAGEGIRMLAGSVHDGVDAVTHQGGEQFDAAETGIGGEIDNLRKAARGKGIALHAQGEASLDAAVAAGKVAQARLAGQAGQLLDETGRDAIEELAGVAARTDAPAVQRQASGPDTDAGLPPVAGEALRPLDRMGPALDQAADNQSAELAGSLRGAATGAGRASETWVDETRSNLDRLGATAETGLDQIADTAGGQVDAAVAEGRTRAAAEVDKVTGQIDTNVGEIRRSVRTGVGEATGRLGAGAQEGAQHADQTLGQVPGAMRAAALAQSSWLGRAGSWFSGQLADTWKAVKGMADWRFVGSLAAGIGVGLLTGIGVALLIAAAPFTLPGLAVVLIVGAVAGAAGFAAAQLTGNLLDPDPNRRWYDGVGHAAILGTFVGAGGLAASFYGLGLAAGALAVMGAAGVGTVVANLATGRDWDDHLLANITIVGIFHALIKSVSDRIPRRGTGPTDESQDYGPVEQHPKGTPSIEIDSPARIRATDFRPSTEQGELTCDLIDSESGAIFGSADVRIDAHGRPLSGPELTLNPRFSKLPNGDPVVLAAPKGFTWTEASLRAAVNAYIRRFGRGPLNMSGQLAWSNLANFQKEYARIRAENPRLPLGVVAERAVRAISFGKHRIAMGYGDISVRCGNVGDVTIKGEVLQNVPRYVEVDARPTTPGVVPVVPQPTPDQE